MPPFLEIAGLGKSFGDQQVLHELSLSLEEGEILALLGLSGSGKTTALRLLAGFETPDRGLILVQGRDVARLGPAARGFGMVFQHYALFPQMTVAENVAFGLEARGAKGPEVAERVAEMLALVDLGGFGGRRVSEISGGQQQRVALARALAPAPKLLLLDEPLSNLDPALRERTRTELRAAVKKVGITTVLVTHEQEEAFHVGDRVAVLHQGRLHQLGTPFELYQRPRTPFVAGFVGRAGVLRGRLVAMAGRSGEVAIADQGGAGVRWQGRLAGDADLTEGQEVDLYVRPEALLLGDDDGLSSGPTNTAVDPTEPAFAGSGRSHGLAARVESLRFTGALTYALCRLGDGRAVEVTIGPDQDVVGRASSVGRRADGPLPSIFPAEEAGV